MRGLQSFTNSSIIARSCAVIVTHTRWEL